MCRGGRRCASPLPHGIPAVQRYLPGGPSSETRSRERCVDVDAETAIGCQNGLHLSCSQVSARVGSPQVSLQYGREEGDWSNLRTLGCVSSSNERSWSE